MKRAVLIAAFLAACHPTIDDFDLSGLDPGPIPGDQGVVSFALVDGCPVGDPLFGCSKLMPPFAVGARVRFVVGATSGKLRDQEGVDSATFEVSNPGVVAVGRDADGFLVMEALHEGAATVELHASDGDLIDSIGVEVQRVALLTPEMQTTILAGAKVGANVFAKGPSGQSLYARGAIVATLTGGLVLDEDNSGFFSSSEMVAVRGDAPASAQINFRAGSVSIDVPYTIVGRDQITAVSVADLWHDPAANKARIIADTKHGMAAVRGGPACDWRIVSGGGEGAALASGAGDDTRDSFWVFYDEAVVYGDGDMTVECRVNDQAIAQTTIHLGL